MRYFILHILSFCLLFTSANAALQVKNYDKNYTAVWDDSEWYCDVVEELEVFGNSYGKVMVGLSSSNPIEFVFFGKVVPYSYYYSDIACSNNFVFCVGPTKSVFDSDDPSRTIGMLTKATFFGENQSGHFWHYMECSSRPHASFIIKFETDELDDSQMMDILLEAHSIMVPTISY